MLLSCGAECTRLPSDHILIWRQHAEDAEVLKTLKMLRQQSACGITLLASSRQCGARRGAALGWTGSGKAHVQLRGSPAGQACTRAATPKLVCTPCPLHRRIVECVSVCWRVMLTTPRAFLFLAAWPTLDARHGRSGGSPSLPKT